MPGSFSPTMKLKFDPNQSLIKVLKKHKLDDYLRDIIPWLNSEPGSPGALKKFWISTFHAMPKESDPTLFDSIEYFDVDLKDPTTWGEANDPLPSDDFFLELFKAIKADDRRYAKRSSYEF